ncbi:DNA gyrase subunit A [bacterium]|nr:DNA gyrase subunit A [bacterium]
MSDKKEIVDDSRWTEIKNVQNVDLNSSMKSSFLSYAMSVIVDRALPDARDGLKPVQRRILYDMTELGMSYSSQFKKSARLVGDVMGKYHPHGDSAIYEATVRMARPFAYRYPLVYGHGNFGSIDGDGAAAMRYTECKMMKITEEMLKDIDKNTVPFQDNYDSTEKEPLYLPSAFPNLLCNGAVGIAVGMATNIPPHNLAEVVDGYLAYMDNNDITTEELMQYVKGPDFPTGGIILGVQGIREAYETGRGLIQVRAKCHIVDQESGKKQIIIEEIPYAVNKTALIERIIELVKEKPLPGQEKKVDGITDIRDESSKGNIRVVIELKKDSSPEIILNNLYKYSQLQTSFSIIMLALVDNQPELLSLKKALEVYYKHQLSVLLNRTQYDLDKCTARKHILEGYVIAIDNVDEIIHIIRNSYDDADKNLMDRFDLSAEQAKAILALPLRRLSGLELEKIKTELSETIAQIEEDEKILNDPNEQHKVLKEQITDIKEKYADERRTEIDYYTTADIDNEDLIPVQDTIVTITETGYVKRMNPDEYHAQNKGGKGKTGMKVHDDDMVKKVLFTSTHDFLLFFTNKGRVFKLKAYRIPQQSRTSKGTPIVNLLSLPDDEVLTAMMSIPNFEDEGYIFFVSNSGTVKRTAIQDFKNINRSGIRALSLKEGDLLHNVLLTEGHKDIIIAASNGKAIRFSEEDVRCMGRNATGVRGIDLEEGDEVIGATVAETEDEQILVLTENGYGKRTFVSEYRRQTRGGKGVKTINITEKNGKLSRLEAVTGDEDLFIITDKGMTIRTHIDGISILSRATQGVKIMNLVEGHKVATMAILPRDEEDEEELDFTATEETSDLTPTTVQEETPVKPEGDKSDEIF